MAVKKLSSVYVGWPRPHFPSVLRDNKHYRSHYNAALLYAHYELSAVELKKEIVKYLKSLDPKHALLDRVAALHENRFITVGKYAYILNNKGELPENVEPGLMPALNKVINEEEERILREVQSKSLSENRPSIGAAQPATNGGTISIQDRIKEKARDAAGEVEGWIDNFHLDRKSAIPTVEDFVNLFKGNDLKAPHTRYIMQAFSRRSEEIAAAIDGKDKDLSAAYSHFTKPELKKFGTFFTNLVKACEMVQEVAKVTRAPRAKKPVSSEKLVAKLKFKKDDSSLGIVSIAPTAILGAKEVWVYNTKTRKLTQYKSQDGDGLGVKGTGITNFGTESAEKTLRKPADTLAEFKKASKVKLRTFLKDLTTLDTQPTGKLNEHHVILRADK